MVNSPVNKAFIYNLQGLTRTAFPQIRSTTTVGKTTSGSTMASTVMVFDLTEGMTIYGLDSKVMKIANQNIGALLNMFA